MGVSYPYMSAVPMHFSVKIGGGAKFAKPGPLKIMGAIETLLPSSPVHMLVDERGLSLRSLSGRLYN